MDSRTGNSEAKKAANRRWWHRHKHRYARPKKRSRRFVRMPCFLCGRLLRSDQYVGLELEHRLVYVVQERAQDGRLLQAHYQAWPETLVRRMRDRLRELVERLDRILGERTEWVHTRSVASPVLARDARPRGRQHVAAKPGGYIVAKVKA